MAAPTACSVDLRELEAELARTKGSFESWAKRKTDAALQTRDALGHAMQDQSAKLASLHARREELGVAVQQVKQRAEREELEATSLKNAMTVAQQEQLSMQQRVSLLRKEVSQQEQECIEIEEATNLDEGIKKKKVNALKKALSLYSSRLGLDFKQSQEVLQLVFSQVDAAQPSKQFVIGVKVQSEQSRMYEVTKCTPSVESLPSLEAELNRTNDFAEFVKAMRAAFQAL